MSRISSLTATVFSILAVLFTAKSLTAQELPELDYSNVSAVPQTKTIRASATHLYVLSESEGMVVFRVYPDSLQWLYTSSGMQRRGNNIAADARFAYLTGNSQQLTVLEPTSVLGVYSSTQLPDRPAAAARIENQLYIALGEAGLGRLSLESPETVDTPVTIIDEEEVDGQNILDVAASETGKQLFVLTNRRKLILYEFKSGELAPVQVFSLREDIKRLFIDKNSLWAATARGDVYTVNSSGLGRKTGSVNEPVSSVLSWQDYTFIRGSSGRVWIGKGSSPLRLWKSDGDAGNWLAKSGSRLFIAENNTLARVKPVGPDADAGSGPVVSQAKSGDFAIKKIGNVIITYPNPLLLALGLENDYPVDGVSFTYRSNVKNADIQKQGFAWQPNPSQIGLNWFTVIASNAAGESDSTRFSVDVRSFNSPPSFSPVRDQSVVVNEAFEIQFKATDPENPASQLIRYIGVDLPLGSQIDENTGLFTWTPDERQIGKNTFRVIASDEQGAASSMEVTLTVLDIE